MFNELQFSTGDRKVLVHYDFSQIANGGKVGIFHVIYIKILTHRAASELFFIKDYIVIPLSAHNIKHRSPSTIEVTAFKLSFKVSVSLLTIVIICIEFLQIGACSLEYVSLLLCFYARKTFLSYPRQEIVKLV